MRWDVACPEAIRGDVPIRRADGRAASFDLEDLFA